MDFNTLMDIEQNNPTCELPQRDSNPRFAPKIQLTIHKPKSHYAKQVTKFRPIPTPLQIAANIVALQLLRENE